MATDSERLAEALAAYDDNADYVADNSATKAAAFVTACTRLLLLIPATSAKGSGNVSYATNLQAIQAARDAAQKWLEARDATYRVGPDVTFGDLTDWRETY